MSYQIVTSDCVVAMREMAEASVDAVVTDPPYELAFMGKRWDSSGIAYSVEMWREVLRVLKPGGYLLSFGGTRTYHRMACAVEDAGFEVRDSIHWLYGSGFPKNYDLSKALDERLGMEREIIGHKQAGLHGGSGCTVGAFRVSEESGPDPETGLVPVTAPASWAARQWEGWGTALKPAHEPIVLARKPLDGPIAENVLRYGTGGLHVEDCRVDFSSDADRESAAPAGRATGKPLSRLAGVEDDRAAFAPSDNNAGRWPPNVLLTHDPDCGGECVPGCPVAELDRQGGATCFGDPVGASRFFPTFRWDPDLDVPFLYCPKPARSERDAGCEGLPGKTGAEATNRREGSAGLNSPRAGAGRTVRDEGGAQHTSGVQLALNHHPTVKPVALMEWLVRLVTPRGGTVLDPFFGSGSTGCAAVRLGFDLVGIERDAEYAAIAERRIRLAMNAPRTKPLGSLERAPAADPRQALLFRPEADSGTA